MRVLIACEFSGTVREAFRARGHDAWSCDLLPSDDSSPFHFTGPVELMLDGYQPVSFTGDCDPLGEGWCGPADIDPAECRCIGPTQDGVEYVERNGTLFGRFEDHPHWDLMIAHPPCTYLCSSGLHWNVRGRLVNGRPRAELTEEALEFVTLLWNAPIKHVCVENPQGCINTRLSFMPKPQYVQPWMFGHDASKKTGLWLRGLPPLAIDKAKTVPGRIVGEDKRGKTVVRWANQTDSGQNKLGPSEDRWAERSITYQGIADAMAEQWGVIE